jgi:uncharacterized surface protein with fasciclin (FAS1) repeats
MQNKNLIITIIVAIIVIIGLWWYFSASSNNGALQTNGTSTAMSSSTQGGVMVGGAAMLPSRNIVANAQNASNLTTFSAALQAAGLVSSLEGAGPFTVFAPTNDAFNKLPSGTVANLVKPANKSQLASILKYHVVSGVYTTADLTDGQTLTTLEGDKLHITKDANGNVMINGTAKIVTPDVIDSNGVSQVIDTVLMPGQTASSSAMSSSSATQASSTQ